MLASSIQFPHPEHVPTLTRMHDQLTKALVEKADAYKKIVEAYRRKDADQFQQGKAKLGDATDKLSKFRDEFSEAVDNGGPSE